MTEGLFIRGGRLVDSSSGRDETGDLWIGPDGRIGPLPETPPEACGLIDASGCVVAPGLIDLHVHLREPGGEESETVASGCRAAAAGGFTSLLAMPNTVPPADHPAGIAFLLDKAWAAGGTRVLACGCLTRGREGAAATGLEELAAAGARAFSDDGSTVRDEEVLADLMRRAAALGLPVIDHAEMPSSGPLRGVMHEGAFARRAGLPGIPAGDEIRAVERDIRLCQETGCRVHIQHVSTAGAVEAIAAARDRGWPVSGEATPHHLALCDADVRPDDPSFKMNPPLRSRADQAALIEGVKSGVLSVLATDHAPHTAAAKGRGFLHAPFGVVGLETAVGVTYTRLAAGGGMALIDWLARWTVGPAEVLGLPPPTLEPGAPGDVVVLELDEPWTVDPDRFLSRSRNTPFAGWTLTGRARWTLRDGRVIHPAE